MRAEVLITLLITAVLLVGCIQQEQPPGGAPGGTPPGQTPGGTPGGQPPADQTPPPNQTPTPPQNETPPTNQTPQPPPQQTTVDMSQLYRYGSLRSYEYVVKSEGTAVNMKTSMSTDTLNGVPAWLQQTEVMMEGVSVTTETWIDKQTYGCLKVMSVINYAGQIIEQPGQCPTEGPNSATQTQMPKLTYAGRESVTVPAGTFMCDKYSYEGMTFWSASNVPVPVKVAYADGSTVMELVSYS